MGRIVPMLAYADAAAAVGWLCEAFGFREDRWLDNPWAVDGVYVEVGDVDAHRARAAAAGARIIRELDDPFPTLRVYTAEDPEGHRWMFAQRGG